MDYGQLSPQTPFVKDLAPLSRADLERARAVLPEDAFSSLSSSLPLPKTYLGAPQWNVPSWKGWIYPAKAKSTEILEHYSRQWNAIELNSSYYATPSMDQILAWKGKTPEDFRFFVKIHQDLSHDPSVWVDAPAREARMARFLQSWSHLGKRWGGSFLQLPPGFSRDRLGDLRRWILDWRTLQRQISPGEEGASTLQIEFRHPSWFRERRLDPAAIDLLSQFEIGCVCTDTPGRRDASHATLTSPFWLIRFLAQSTEDHAEPLAVDLERIEKWAIRLAELTKRGMEGFAFFVHTPEHRWVPELSNTFERIFRERVSPASPQAGFRSPTPLELPPPEPDLFSTATGELE